MAHSALFLALPYTPSCVFSPPLAYWGRMIKSWPSMSKQPSSTEILVARTSDVELAEQVEYWSSAFGSIWGRVQLAPEEHQSFSGDLHSVQVASLRANRISFGGLRFRRIEANSEQAFYSLAFPQRGQASIRMGNDGVALRPGSMFLLDNSRPAEFFACNSYETLNIQIPICRMKQRIGKRFNSSFLRVDASQILPELLQDILIKVSALTSPLEPRSATLLEQQICDIAAFCFAPANASESEEGVLLLAQRERSDKHITRLHARPDLSPSMIARACGISESYLHKIYRGSGQTVMERVKELRLETAHTLLCQKGRTCTVSEVAYEVGFKSLAEFSRAYKKRFGTSPRRTRL